MDQMAVGDWWLYVNIEGYRICGNNHSSKSSSVGSRTHTNGDGIKQNNFNEITSDYIFSDW